MLIRAHGKQPVLILLYMLIAVVSRVENIHFIADMEKRIKLIANVSVKLAIQYQMAEQKRYKKTVICSA